MRQIGTLPKGLDPKFFADYLLGLGIKTRGREQPEGWRLWIYNEDHFTRAREELPGVREPPDDLGTATPGSRRGGTAESKNRSTAVSQERSAGSPICGPTPAFADAP